MATTKLWNVKSRVDNAVNYIMNKDKTKNKYYDYEIDKYETVRGVLMYATNSNKTEKQYYVSGINCNVQNAVKEMQIVKQIYGKENGILAFHGEQSFKEGEVTPELAHEIGVRLAEEMWGDRFQVVVTTHLNTKHIHNHFVLNSVSFKDGKKYYSNRENTALLRKTSDELCEEYGLSVLKEKTCKSRINFENYYKKSLANSDYYRFAKEDLDYAIKNALTIKQFEKILVSMGYNYYYRAGKLSIRKEPHKRNIRVERAFGEEYSVENIEKRIYNNPLVRYDNIKFCTTIKGKKLFGKGKIRRRYKPKGIVALYYYYCYLLKVYPKNKMQYKLSPEMRREVRKLEQYSEKVRFVCKNKLETLKDVSDYKDVKQEKLRKLYNARNRLYYKRKGLNSSDEKDVVNEEIIKVTGKIKMVKKEIKMCDEVEEKTNKMVEDVRFVEAEKWKKQDEKNKVKDKKKVR